MHYVSKDPIANLKVKVVVTRISALKRNPKYAEQVRSMGENGTKSAQLHVHGLHVNSYV